MGSESSMTVAEHLSKVGVDVNGDSCRKVPGCCRRWPPSWRSPIDRAGKHERSEERYRHANGYKPKIVQIRLSDITFDISQASS